MSERGVGRIVVLTAALASVGMVADAQVLDLNASADAALIQKFRPPAVDRALFETWPQDRRVLQSPKIKYQPRKDGYDFCARITGIPVSDTSRPMACAYWNVRRNECTVITPEVTAYNYLGHELRHCFDGAFHD